MGHVHAVVISTPCSAWTLWAEGPVPVPHCSVFQLYYSRKELAQVSWDEWPNLILWFSMINLLGIHKMHIEGKEQ